MTTKIKLKKEARKDFKLNGVEKQKDFSAYWEKRILTIDEVAKLFNCSIYQVNQLVKDGLPCKSYGYVKLFSIEQILNWIEGGN